MAKDCEVCGKSISRTSRRRRYCGEECAQIGHYGVREYMGEVRECLVCREKFVPYRPGQVYCKDKCQMRNYNMINDVAGRLRQRRLMRKRQKEALRIPS